MSILAVMCAYSRPTLLIQWASLPLIPPLAAPMFYGLRESSGLFPPMAAKAGPVRDQSLFWEV